MSSSMRRFAIVGLTGVAVVTGIAAGAGVANASTTSTQPTPKKPHTTHHHTAKHAPRIHAASAGTRTFATKHAGVELRSTAGTGPGSRVVRHLGATGTPVAVSCYTVGASMSHDHVWYRTTDPAGAYVAGTELRSGHDPAAGVKHC